MGLTDKGFQFTKIPGSTRKSYSLRWDGKPFHGNSYSTYPPLDLTMKKDDVVGCGVDFDNREIFFTHNGKYLGAVFTNVELREYYPTLCLSSFGEQATCRFVPPFQFDLEGLVYEEGNKASERVTQETIEPCYLHDLVHDYLTYEGYADTLKEFDSASKYQQRPIESRGIMQPFGRVSETMEPIFLSDSNICGLCGSESSSKVCENCLKLIVARVEPSSPVKLPVSSPPLSRKGSEQPFALHMERCDSADLSTFYLKPQDTNMGNSHQEVLLEPGTNTAYEEVRKRGEIRKLIRKGEISAAKTLLITLFPHIEEQRPECLLALHLQQFIELISNTQPCDALLFARKHLSNHRKSLVLVRNSADEWVPMTSVLGLLCYIHPETSPLAFLLSQNQRDLTADVVNRTVLGEI